MPIKMLLPLQDLTLFSRNRCWKRKEEEVREKWALTTMLWKKDCTRGVAWLALLFFPLLRISGSLERKRRDKMRTAWFCVCVRMCSPLSSKYYKLLCHSPPGRINPVQHCARAAPYLTVSAKAFDPSCWFRLNFFFYKNCHR